MRGHPRTISPGEGFGRLVAVRPVTKQRWWFRCACGTEIERWVSVVAKGNTTSCGCAQRDVTAARNRAGATHGHSQGSRTYRSWSGMWTRCTNEKVAEYKNYGARGIWVDEEWRSFAAFLRDMGERPPGRSIDRIDNDGPYTKSNCRWSTPKEQCANKRNSKRP